MAKRKATTNREPLTRARFDALFEEGGRDLAWQDVEQELSDVRKKAAAEGVRAAWEDGRRWRDTWAAIIQSVLIGVAVTEAFIGLAAWHRAAARAGDAELAACAAGRLLPCQMAVDDSEHSFSSDGRVGLYRTAYKEATGHDLPKMEGE